MELSRKFRIIVFAVKIVFALVVLYWLNRHGMLNLKGLKDFAEKPLTLLLLVFMMIATFPLCSVRWYVLLKKMGIEIPLYSVFKMVYQSAFWGLFLPGVVGGDGVRILYGIKHTPEEKIKMSISVFVDRLFGIIALLSLGGLAGSIYLLGVESHSLFLIQLIIALVVFCFLVVIAFIISLITRRRIEFFLEKKMEQTTNSFLKKLYDVFESFNILLKSPIHLCFAYIISVAIHLKNLVILMLICKIVIKSQLGFIESVIAGTITFIVNFLPLTPGGLGLGEATFGQIANSMANASGILPFSTIMVIFRIILMISLLPALLIIVAPNSLRDKKRIIE